MHVRSEDLTWFLSASFSMAGLRELHLCGGKEFRLDLYGRTVLKKSGQEAKNAINLRVKEFFPIRAMKSGQFITIAMAPLFVLACWAHPLWNQQSQEENSPLDGWLAFVLLSGTIPNPPVTEGTYLWLNNQNITTTGTSVTTWNDSGPNGLDLSTWVGSPSLASSILNGLSAVDFPASGVVGLHRTSGFTGITGDFTVFLIFQPRGTTGLRKLLQFGNGLCGAQSNFDLYIFSDGTIRLDQQGNANILTTASSVQAGTGQVLILVRDTTAPTTTAYLNGAQTAQILSAPAFTNSPQIWMGTDCSGTGVSNLDGYISELIIFSRALTAAELNQMNCYANAKYLIGIAHSC